MKKLLLFFFALLLCETLSAQISGKLMQYPDVSDTHITFVYGDDVWVTSKSGGIANRLSSPEGPESFPRFSPDGTMIAYTANYHGNSDVYIINTNGGIPQRLTYHDMPDRVLGWTPDGQSVLFASSRESGRQRYNQFYTVSIQGGSPNKLSVPYGEYASFSSEGQKIAYTDRTRVHRNWKRYRGGTAPDITVFDLNTFKAENITNNTANDELPMWIDNAIYYMSDNGPHKRNNLWKYDIASKTNIQLTEFKDYDITYPESSNFDIIFEAGGKLYLFNLASKSTTEVNIQLITDQKELIPELKEVSSYIQNMTISPNGKRVVIQARGELFNLPAEEGFVTNISATTATAERKPAWSPDGNYVACWSDANGEYQLMLYDMKGNKAPKVVTNFKTGFYYSIFWSPDSKKIAFIDQAMSISFLDVNTGITTKADQGKYMFEGNLRNFSISWSPDSRWFTYSHGLDNRLSSALFLYDTQNKQLSQLTSGYYTDTSPTFSKDGKYLFFTTNRTFSPLYSDIDNTFVYPNTTGIAVGTLNKTISSILEVKNDSDEKDDDKKDEKDDKKEDEKKDEAVKVNIEVSGFEERIELLDIEAGNLSRLNTVEDKLLFVRRPNSGASKDIKATLNYYDFKERKVETIISDVSNYDVSAEGKNILVNQDGKLAVLEIKKDLKIDKTVPTKEMTMHIVPKEEWKQIFNDVWRFERDYFYDPGMHGVNWNLMKERYGSLIDQANTRNDVNIIIGDLIAELNASHTYNGGGDISKAKKVETGYLGADIALENGYYRIKKIIKAAPWDAEARSALDKPGLDVKEGHYIIAVNGLKVDTSKPIHAAFQGLSDKTVQLTINSSPSELNSKHIIVKTLKSETRLRHLAWIENNRQRVSEVTNGKVGYVYVRSTGRDGQNELARQFYAQLNKEALIIDERFNSGGQIPDRFIELLDREPLAFWAVRDGEDWAWPPAGNFGPKVMLINGFSGSGGDAFPDYFKKRELGPLIGTRTWGGLIGISGTPNLIDNGNVTVPTFRMYNPDGEWFKEGHGVDPDIHVVEDFEKLAKGTDAQLEIGIQEVLRLLNSNKTFKSPNRPAYENRN